MKEVKKADDVKINELSEIESDLKAKNLSLEKQLVVKTQTIDEMKSKVHSLSEPQLPMTVLKENIEVISKCGSDFNNHVDFIKQTIVQVLASSKKICDDADVKLEDAIRKWMNNNKVNSIVFESERDSNTFSVHRESSLYLTFNGLSFIFFTKSRV